LRRCHGPHGRLDCICKPKAAEPFDQMMLLEQHVLTQTRSEKPVGTVVPRYIRLRYSRAFCSDKRTLREEHCHGYSRISLVVGFFEGAKEPTITRDYCISSRLLSETSCRPSPAAFRKHCSVQQLAQLAQHMNQTNAIRLHCCYSTSVLPYARKKCLEVHS
jgi:hypothetical protein